MLVALDVREGQRVRRGDRLGTVEIQSANALSADPAAESPDIVARERAQIGERRHLATAASPAERTRLDPTPRQLHPRLQALDRPIPLQPARVTPPRTPSTRIAPTRPTSYHTRRHY